MDSTIIAAKLDEKALEDSIKKLVNTVDKQMGKAAETFDSKVQAMEGSLQRFSTISKQIVGDVKDSFTQLGMSFDAFVNAMKKIQSSGGGGAGGGKGSAQPGTVGELRQQIAEAEKLLNTYKVWSDELQKQVDLLAKQKQELKDMLTSSERVRQEDAKRVTRNAMSMPHNDLQSAEARLQRMKDALLQFGNGMGLSVEQTNRLVNAIQKAEREIEKIRGKQTPSTTAGVLGMSENSLDAIQKKMAAIRDIMAKMDYRKQGVEMRLLGDDYKRLGNLQTQLLTKYQHIEKANSSLERSFRYIRNRIIYTFTIGSITGFIRQLYQVRGEYEMLERSIGILIDDMERGKAVFNELNEMALKSPFTLIELGTAAKQLSAYNFAADELVDMTKRLADIGAALGVPMERLVYNLGQIKAQGVLNARDARDFANAGLAIVPMLAQMYTEQKRFGDEVVTTAKVYDMMKKKMVAYSDVLNVIKKVTDEGGKFFDFQAKQADTMKVQLANLTLAWNNMLNDIGESNQDTLSRPIQLLKSLLQNWREVYRVIMSIITVLGVFKARLLLIGAIGVLNRLVDNTKAYIVAIQSATTWTARFNAVMSKNVVGFLVTLLASAVAYFGFFNNSVEGATEAINMFGEEGAKTIRKMENFGKILRATDETSALHKKTIEELNTVLNDYGIAQVEESDNLSTINEKREKAIELIKEEAVARNYANKMAAAEEKYSKDLAELQTQLQDMLGEAVVGKYGKNNRLNELVRSNASVLSQVIIDTAQEYSYIWEKENEKAFDKNFAKFENAMFARIQRALGGDGEAAKALAQSWSTFRWGSLMMEDGKLQLGGYTNIFQEFYEQLGNISRGYDEARTQAEHYRAVAEDMVTVTMSSAEKQKYYAQKLKNTADSAKTLYDKIYTIVDYAKKNSHNTITFDLKLTAEKPPKWMLDMDLPKLQQLARNFTSIAQSGQTVKGYTVEGTYKQGLLYAAAARAKELEEERKALDKPTKDKKPKKEVDELGQAIAKEVQLIGEMQKKYEEYKKIGVDATQALELATTAYGKSLELTNKQLQKFGVQTLSVEKLSKMDLRDVKAFYEQQLTQVQKGKGSVKAVESLEKVIANLGEEITKIDYKKVVDGLNNELSKLKDEYELGIQLDANPELGEMFSDMFGLDTSTLPRTFGAYLSRAQASVDKALQELGEKRGKDISPFNIMKDDLENWAKANEVDKSMELYNRLDAKQKELRNAYEKNVLDVSKMLDEEVKKYGILADKLVEIEEGRLKKIRDLNNKYYNEEMRKSPEYKAALSAINRGAQRESGVAKFDDFKNSPLYTFMFRDLQTLSSNTIDMLRTKLHGLSQSFGELNPEQLKQVQEYLTKLDDEAFRRNPFKGLVGSYRQYIDALKQRSQVEAEAMQKEAKKNALQDKLQAKLMERNEAQRKGDNAKVKTLDIEIDALREMFNLSDDELQKLLDYLNLLNKNASTFEKKVVEVTQKMAKWGQETQKLRDTLKELNINLGGDIDQAIDSFATSSQEAASAAQAWASHDYFTAAVEGLSATVHAVDGVATLFGHGMKDYYTSMKESVDKLNSIFEKAIEYHLETLDRMSGPEAVREYKRIVDLNKQSEQSYRDLADAAGRSGSSWRSHSHAYKTNRALSGEWARLTQIAGQPVDSVQDMYDLPWDKLEAIMVNAPDAWSKLHDDIRESLEGVIESGKKAEEYADKLRTAITSISLDGLQSDFESMLNAWEGDSTEFFDKFKSNIKQAIVRGIMTSYADEALKGWLNHLQGYMEDGNLSEQEYNQSRLEYEQIVNEATSRLQAASSIIGQSLEKSKDLSALQQGIKGITENQAGAIEAYLNGVSQQVYLHSSLLTQIHSILQSVDFDMQMGMQAQMLLQLQESHQVQVAIQNILNACLTPSGNGFVVELR